MSTDLLKSLADERSAEPTTRLITLADGTPYVHQVEAVSWTTVAYYVRARKESGR